MGKLRVSRAAHVFQPAASSSAFALSAAPAPPSASAAGIPAPGSPFSRRGSGLGVYGGGER